MGDALVCQCVGASFHAHRVVMRYEACKGLGPNASVVFDRIHCVTSRWSVLMFSRCLGHFPTRVCLFFSLFIGFSSVVGSPVLSL